MQGPDETALELEEIMHPMSPSPAPPPAALPPEIQVLPEPQLQVEEAPQHGNNASGYAQVNADAAHVNGTPDDARATPEPLDQPEVESMRQRVLELGLPESTSPNTTPLERELANMVLRLTSGPILHPSTAQLAAQADTISALTLQRALLLDSRDSELARWSGARERWERTTEALVRKQLASREPTSKDYYAEQIIARLKDENGVLRYKLADTNNRLSALESELKRLRPLLMVQPSFLGDPAVLQHASLVDFTPPEDRHESRSKSRRHSDHSKKEKDDTPAPAQTPTTADTQRDATSLAPEINQPPANPSGEIGVRPQDLTLAPGQKQPEPIPAVLASTLMPPPALKPTPSRPAPTDKKKLKEKRTRFRAPGPRTPLLSDARAECVLTAARRIGRVRAGIAAGLVRARLEAQVQVEAPGPAEGEPGPSNYAAYPPQPQPQPHPHSYAMPGFVYMQAVPSPPGGRAVQAQVPQGAMIMPVWPMQGAGGRQQGVNPALQSQGMGRGRGLGRGPGSLDSLLTAATAARTMMVGQDSSGAGAGEETEKEDDEEDEEEVRQAPVRAAKRPQRRRSAATSAPKRRKTGTSASTSTGAAGSTARASGGGAGRTRRPTKKAQEALDQAQDRKGKGKQREVPAAAPTNTKNKTNGTNPPARAVHAHPPAPTPAPVPVARVRSALDVLADQAAQEQERMPVSGARSGRLQESAEPARGARVGPSMLARTHTAGTVLEEEPDEEEEEPEELGPEEEEGVSGDEAEGEGSVEVERREGRETPLVAGSRTLMDRVGTSASAPVRAGA